MKCSTPHTTPRNKLNNGQIPYVRLTNISIGSPLRRSLLRQSVAPQSAISQDDDSERLKRRSVADVERRISNVVLPEITPRKEQEIHQHFQLCLKLFAENKITMKNVWDLKIIEYAPIVLQSQKQIRDYLQLGATSLDVSAKIYGLRVDDAHSDALKLAHTMTSVSNKKRGYGDEENQDENEDPVDAEDKANSASKKRKTKTRSLKNKNTVVKNVKTITGLIPTLVSNCFQTRSGVDFNSVSDLRTNTLPLHPYGHHFMNLSMDPAWATYAMVDEGFKEETETVKPWPLKVNKKKLKICAAFTGFEIDNWDPEQDSHLIDSPNSSYNNVVVFNENGLPVPELDGSVHNFTIFRENEGNGGGDSSEDERIEAHTAVHVEPEFITDFRPEERNTVSGEYSYAKSQACDDEFRMQLLAGPSHWKFKRIRPAAIKFSGAVEQHQQKPKRPRKNKREDPEVVDILNCSLFEENLKYKPRKNPIKYDPERITQQQILFDEKFLSINIPFLSKPQFFKTNYVDPPKDGVEDEVQPYNYQNPLDSEYCSQPAPQSFNNSGVDDNDDNAHFEDGEEEVAAEKCANAEPEKVADVRHLLGDNLVEAPQMVKKNFISYALQPKKLNMKKLKDAVRRCLVTEDNSSKYKQLSEEQQRELPIRQTSFQNIYKRVPEIMPKSEKNELSRPTVFVALLHLVNEYHLEIIKQPNDLTDFEIKK